MSATAGSAVRPWSSSTLIEVLNVPLTVGRLTRKLENHFLGFEAGEGSPLSSDGLTSDLLPGANRTTVLATQSVSDRGGIRLQVRDFVGATASIEIRIFPRNIRAWAARTARDSSRSWSRD